MKDAVDQAESWNSWWVLWENPARFQWHGTVVSKLNYSTAMTLYGMALNDEGNWREAKRTLTKALKLRKKYLCKNNLYTARTEAALGIAVYWLGNKKRGLSYLDSSKTRAEQVDPQHHLASYIYLQYGHILFNAKNFRHAFQCAQQAIACIEEACESHIHPNVAEGHLLQLNLCKELNEGDGRYHEKKLDFICSELIKHGVNVDRLCEMKKNTC